MGKNWVAGAIKHPGSLHRELGVPQGTKIPAKKLAKAAHSDKPGLKRKAVLAETLEGMHHGGHHSPPPSRLQENPGEADMHMHPVAPVMESHSFKPPASTQVHGYGHSQAQRHGVHRHSGNPNAHRIGHK
jgi:hypothetical protein